VYVFSSVHIAVTTSRQSKRQRSIGTSGFICKDLHDYKNAAIEYEEYRLNEFTGKVLRRIFGSNGE
jgi:hypothetical protein